MQKILLHTIAYFQKHLELLFWISALILLFFLPVEKSESSLCVFSWVGFGACPGCGIGHAIYYALHGQFRASVHHHPLGIFAIMVIFIRIKQLLYLPKPIA